MTAILESIYPSPVFTPHSSAIINLHRSQDVLVKDLATPNYPTDIWYSHRYIYIRHTYTPSPSFATLVFSDHISSYTVGFLCEVRDTMSVFSLFPKYDYIIFCICGILYSVSLTRCYYNVDVTAKVQVLSQRTT